MTFISRILGFLRDMIAAHLFGATGAVDAFLVAFKIPNFLRNLFAEGSFSQAFVPVLSEYRKTRSHSETKLFISHVCAALGGALIIISVLGFLGAPIIVNLFAPGFYADPTRYELAVHMLRITFPYIFFISLTAFAGSILNSYGQFAAAAFAPSLLNLVLIGTALWLSPYLHIPVESQAIGIFIAGVAQISFLIPFLKKLGFLTWPVFDLKDPGVKRVLTLMIPSLFGASIGQISILINTVFASFLPVGSVTWLYYAERLAYFPLGVIGVALATVILPHLSSKHAEKSHEEFEGALDWGLRMNLIVGSLASTTMWVLSGPLVVTLFEYGKYNFHDVLMTQKSVMAYAIGLQAFMLNKMLSSAFYARQNIKTPVRIGIITIILNFMLNAALILPLKHAGLALATSLAQWGNVVMLLYALQKYGIFTFKAHWVKFLSQLVLANAFAAWIMVYAARHLHEWSTWHYTTRFSHLFLWLFAAALVYSSTLYLVGLRKQHLQVQ